jgi:hypothetical protein
VLREHPYLLSKGAAYACFLFFNDLRTSMKARARWSSFLIHLDVVPSQYESPCPLLPVQGLVPTALEYLSGRVCTLHTHTLRPTQPDRVVKKVASLASRGPPSRSLPLSSCAIRTIP